MNKKKENLIKTQAGDIIHTIHPSGSVMARIFSQEQREMILQLMSKGYMPHHSAVGTGKATHKHWTVEEYQGRYGIGYKMITASPYSSRFSHLTYFIQGKEVSNA